MDAQTQKDTGSVFGAVLLISGCCVGAGMLGLPVLSALAGFEPSFFLFILSWLFMACTGLLLLEVNLWFEGDVSIITMADSTLGWVGKAIGWIGFLFLFYALMVAYISGTGQLFSDFFREITGVPLDDWIGSLIISLLFGLCIYAGTRTVDYFNRFLMAGLVLAYILLIALGIPHIDMKLLEHKDWTEAVYVVPAMIISFGYHNLVPSIKTYLGGQPEKLREALLIGSFIPLIIYLLWQGLILGLIPLEGEGGFRKALGKGDMATQALKTAVGSSWVVDLAQHFAFFAIVTSFLGVALSFVDFLADGLHIKKNGKGKFLLCSLVIGPPFVFALVYPKIFLIALNYAGGFGAVLLFGILPAAMVWAGRYHHGLLGKHQVPGGKTLLICIIAIALGVMGIQLCQTLGAC